MHKTAKFTSTLALLGAVMTPLASWATCWDEASNDYGIPVDVLKAIAKTESGFRANAVNKNANSTRDLGMMQINTKWIPTLSKFGISENDLFDACTNVKVGAWILSKNSERLGWNWDAIGAYNVGCAKLDKAECARRRATYSWKVFSALQKKDALEGKAAAATRLTSHGSPDVDTKARKIVAISVSEAPSSFVRIEPESFLAYAETEVQEDE